jgi:hypothetical protein
VPVASVFTRGYERLRDAASCGSGGWRLGLGVLLTQGVVAWMAAWTALPASTADLGGIAAGSSRAESLSTTTPSPATTSTEGGEKSPARSSFLPAATADIVAVLAAMTLAHARGDARCASSADQETKPHECPEHRQHRQGDRCPAPP